MSKEAWNTAVASFRSAVDNEESDDHTIHMAWTALRQNYGKRFNAKVLLQPIAQQKPQPFALWVVDHLDENILKKVLSVVFASDLAQCDHLSLLKSTASMANTTMWHIILYFGASAFSSHIVGHIRRRIHAFGTDPNDGSWRFADAYTRMLKAAAERHNMPLDSTTIPCPQQRVFIRPDLNALASANPEFDQRSSRKAETVAELAPVKKKEVTTSTTGTTTGYKPKAKKTTTTKKAPSASDSLARRENLLPSRNSAHAVAAPYIALGSPHKARDSSGRVAPRTPDGANSKYDYIPSAPPENQGDLDAGDDIRRNSRRKGRAGQDMVSHMLQPKLENIEVANSVCEFPPPARRDQSMGLEEQPRELSTIYVQTREPHCAQLKHPADGEAREADTAHYDGSKRANMASSRSDLLDQNLDWDDETILHVLKQLTAMCPGEWTVINGMETEPASPSVQRRGGDGEKGTLLIPLKLEDGQRMLVVVDLQPVYNSRGGIIRYYDPVGAPNDDATVEHKADVLLAPLLSRVLPDRVLNQTDWVTAHCIFPELVSKEDSGLAVCLAAMYEVGGRPFPEYWDLGFWRYLVLGGFFPDDDAVQFRVRHYRNAMVSKLIRQGKMSDGFLTHRGNGPSSGDIEALRTAARNSLDRIKLREENSGKAITAIHEGYKIFQTLQENIDMGKASFRAQLDKSAYIQKDIRRKLKLGLFEGIPEIEQDEQRTLQGAMQERTLCRGYLKGLDAAGDCVHRVLSSLTVWRRTVNEAVMEEDKSLLMRSIE